MIAQNRPLAHYTIFIKLGSKKYALLKNKALNQSHLNNFYILEFALIMTNGTLNAALLTKVAYSGPAQKTTKKFRT